MTAVLETLTDFEIHGLHNNFCLADGHAYQDLHPAFYSVIQSLSTIWENAARLSIPEAEQLFHQQYYSLINAPELAQCNDHFKICPTASNSIDIVGAVLSHLNKSAVLIEPTFDNLALLLRRRGVYLDSISDVVLFQAAEANEIDERLPDLKKYGALMLVHPNNPTGLVLSEAAFRNIVRFCESHQIILVIDNCFRIYRRHFFPDYSILLDSSVSFVTIEDTGKVWPTLDLKASLMYFSDDLKAIFTEIYNEIYLCVSNLTLGILSAFFKETQKVGMRPIFWDLVDKRRKEVREVIADSHLKVSDISIHSHLPVEWLTCTDPKRDDFAICQELREMQLAVLPGRQFYWNSAANRAHQRNIRVSLMKREPIFLGGLAILQRYCAQAAIDLAKGDAA